MAKKKEISPENVTPRDGYDNTGTQGYDSLSEDAFTSSSEKTKKMKTIRKAKRAARLKISRL